METMTKENAAPRLSAWEVRERMKNTRSQVPVSSRISSSAGSISLHNIDEVGLQTGLPSAFRNTTQTRKPVKSPLLKEIESAGKLDSSTDSDGSTELNLEPKTKSKSDFKVRKKPVFDAISKYVADDNSTIANTDDQDEKSTSSNTTSRASLGSIPPVRRIHNISAYEYGKTNPSLNLSMGLSEHARDIQRSSSAAADERWARFKLLGRLSLGDIEVPEEAKPSVECNVRTLQRAIKNIVAHRDEDELNASVTLDTVTIDFHILDEVKKIVELPTQSKRRKRDVDSIELGATIQSQLEDYTTVIYSMYRANHFHNFDHASNVLRAVNELVSQVAAPDDLVNTDPLTQFALIFSALIHDVDHSGVPNVQLIKEKSSVAGAYHNKSVAEQNSIELAWNLLMESCYKDLRECIFKTQAEMIRFRGLVVTAVMATDIADQELAAMRKGRAAKALSAEDEEAISTEAVSQKATFVLETLVQAADVSHTMGPYDAYKKWNQRLYKEMYTAYKCGRAGTDPTGAWYKGEFGFFDFYVLPLARQLKSCGVFDEVCDDWLNNAMANRKLWEAEGEAIVAGFLEEMNPKPKITFTNMASMHSTASPGPASGPDDTSVANSFHDTGDSIASDSDVDISISSGESTLEEEKKEGRKIRHTRRMSETGGIAWLSPVKKPTKAKMSKATKAKMSNMLKTSKDDASKKKPVEEEKEEPQKVTKGSFAEPLATGRLSTKPKSASVGGSRIAAIAKVFGEPEPSPKKSSEKPKSKKIKRIVRPTKTDDPVNVEPEKAAKKKKKKAEKSADNKSEESDKAMEIPPSARRRKSMGAMRIDTTVDNKSEESEKAKEMRPSSVRRRKSSVEPSIGRMSINSNPPAVKARKSPTEKKDEERKKTSTLLDVGADQQKISTPTRMAGEKIKRRIKRTVKSETNEKAPAQT